MREKRGSLRTENPLSADGKEIHNVKVLNLQRITGISGTMMAKSYDVIVTLLNNMTFSLVNVAEWDGCRHYDMLIGIDIISRGDFRIVNRTGKRIFTFKV